MGGDRGWAVNGIAHTTIDSQVVNVQGRVISIIPQRMADGGMKTAFDLALTRLYVMAPGEADSIGSRGMRSNSDY